MVYIKLLVMGEVEDVICYVDVSFNLESVIIKFLFEEV